MITDAKAEAALNYLVETDDVCAELKADMERQDYKLRSMKATVFSLSDGTVADRNAEVEMASAVKECWEAHVKAIQAFHAMNNRRTTQALIIEVWRSVNANRRKAA